MDVYHVQLNYNGDYQINYIYFLINTRKLIKQDVKSALLTVHKWFNLSFFVCE